MPTNINDPDEIIRTVGRQEEQTLSLRDRMEGDYRLYRLEPFQEVDGYGHPVEGFRSYTSNAPQVYADKVIQWIARAEFGIRIPQAGRTRAQRAVDALKEKWTWGLMRSVDRRIQQRMEPPMRDLTAFHNVVRGMVAGRWLMMNTASGETVVDMTPWDPIHTYWTVGTDGLEWACYKVSKTRGEMRAEYGVDVGEDLETLRVGAQDGDDAELDVYDFYDRTYNTVVAGSGVVLKRPTPHGAGRVPVVIVPVGPVPLVQTDSAADSVSDYGESVFKSNREIYDKHNLMMSIFLELAARARRPPLGVKSRDGRKTLDEDPYLEGTTISMSEGDDVEAFPLLKTTQDAAELTGRISGEVQRGSIPHSVYGELQFQLSGFAINTLRSGLDSVLRPRLIAEASFYRQGLELLTEQYASGRFSALSGSAGANSDAAMTPDAIARGGMPEIRLEGKLPEDDTAKYAQARMAREGEVPLLPDRWIYDNILKIRDADNIEQAVSAQVARRGTPESLMLNSMIASADQGDDDYARLYESELRLARMRKLLELQALREEVEGERNDGSGRSSGGRSAGPSARVLSELTEAERLEVLGLAGPGG